MKRMPIYTAIGLILMLIGTALADIETILIPVAIMATGALLAMLGKKRGEQDEQGD